MAVEERKVWKCDICGEAKTDGKLPPGWVQFDVEDSYLERCWHAHHVCASCVAKIIKISGAPMEKALERIKELERIIRHGLDAK